MQKKFTNESFEQFLQQSAEAFEMPPSSKVWKGISKKSSKRKIKYYLITISFLVSSFLTGFILLKHDTLFTQNAQTIKSAIRTSSVSGVKEKNVLPTKKSNTILSKKALTQNAKPTIAKNNSLAQTQNKSIVYEYWQMNLLQNSKPVHLRTKAYSVSKIPATYSPKNHLQKMRSRPNDPLVKTTRKTGKFSTQLFFTPTITYHKLSGNKSYLLPPASSNTALPDYPANNTVSNMPHIGLELGFTSKYHLVKNLRLRGGFQFNINRYNMKAFGSPGAHTNPFDYYYGADSVNRITDLPKAGSTTTGRLENYYVQVAAPVGMEIKFYGNDKMQFGIASTVQPTYRFGNLNQLVTTDFKSFTRTPLPVRRWNLNTSFETFASYSTGSVQWQVGPQVRYQIFSSFVDKHPVKENLFDFGVKVGVSLNQQ